MERGWRHSMAVLSLSTAAEEFCWQDGACGAVPAWNERQRRGIRKLAPFGHCGVLWPTVARHGRRRWAIQLRRGTMMLVAKLRPQLAYIAKTTLAFYDGCGRQL